MKTESEPRITNYNKMENRTVTIQNVLNSKNKINRIMV